jgi:hypothetical protein
MIVGGIREGRGPEGKNDADRQHHKGQGRVLALLFRQHPKPHLSKISTMVQAKRRSPSGICKATAKQSRDMRGRGLEKARMGILPHF